LGDKTCFVIAPIGEADSEIRKRSDQIFKHVITPTAAECGYDPLRADHISEPGMITSQVIQHIMNDPLVVADLTGRNPNVFYELALRHALRKPLVQIIKRGEQIPFDVAGTRTIPVDRHDLDSVETAKEEIVKQIKAIEKKPADIETPISVSIDLQNLKQSGNPEQRSLGDLLTAVTEVRTGLANVEKRLTSQMAPMSAEHVHQLEYYLDQSRKWFGNITDDVDELNRELSQLDFDDVDTIQQARVERLRRRVELLQIKAQEYYSNLIFFTYQVSPTQEGSLEGIRRERIRPTATPPLE
jgi:hypothetical protein